MGIVTHGALPVLALTRETFVLIFVKGGYTMDVTMRLKNFKLNTHRKPRFANGWSA